MHRRCVISFFVFFFKQKTAYEMRISDWSSDVCSSDLWLASQKRKLSPATYDKAVRMLEANVFPWLGSRPLAEIDAPELLAVLKRIEARGAHETAHRVQARMGQVFRYAIAPGTATREHSAPLPRPPAPASARPPPTRPDTPPGAPP